ncbi:MAG: hypothetical protein GY862_30565 [Gammaproteobacteria bacterium]|nr:hypothetical protein [Gammaproteobacteria bacterium]
MNAAIYSYPEWIAEIAEKVDLSKTTLGYNCSLHCFCHLVRGCASSEGRRYFVDYPQAAHCDSPEIPEK